MAKYITFRKDNLHLHISGRFNFVPLASERVTQSPDKKIHSEGYLGSKDETHLQGFSFCLRNEDHGKDQSHSHNDPVHPEDEAGAEAVTKVEEGLGHQKCSGPVSPSGQRGTQTPGSPRQQLTHQQPGNWTEPGKI